MTTRPRVADCARVGVATVAHGTRRRMRVGFAGLGLALALLLAPLVAPGHPAAAHHLAQVAPGQVAPGQVAPGEITPAHDVATAPVEAKTIDRFYAIDMMGGRAGWMHAKETTSPDGTITSDSVVAFTLKRGPVSVDIRMETGFVEKADGTPVSMRSFQRMAKVPMETTYTFTPEGVRVSTVQGAGKPIESLEPLPEGEWLTPAAAERFVKARRAAGAKVITLRTIDPSAGLTPVVVERTEGDVEKMKVLGREIDVIKSTLKTTMEGMNVLSVEYADMEGVSVRSDTSIGGIDMTMTLMTREDAMKQGAAPEIMVATFLTPDKPIRDPRNTSIATYTLRAADGELDVLPTTGSQRVERVDASTLRVTVDGSFPNAPEGEVDVGVLTRATPMANADDPAIRAIAEEAVKDLPEGATQAQKAEALRRAAHAYINAKNLGVGFASASEVAKTRAGDCTEHAVFLVALLRAQGIPSRGAAGLIYADQFAGAKDIFGYHMWSQALVETDKGPRWVDLDATLPDSIPFDATHITLATTDLSGEDAASSMLPIASVMGRLSISVDSIAHAGDAK